MVDETLLPKTPTSLGSWLLLVAQAIDGYGVDSQPLFVKANIDINELKKPNSRIPIEKTLHFWRQALEATQDPYIAITVAKHFKPTAFSALGMALAASRNVYDALYRAARYSQMISDGSNTFIDEESESVAFVIKARPPLNAPVSQYGIESLICTIFNILKSIAGDTLKVKEVHLQHAFTGKLAPYEEFFGGPIYFSANTNQIIFHKKDILEEQAFSNSALTCTLDEWIEEHLDQYKENLVSTRVQKYILKHIASGEVDQKKVASELALSPRMLQRKLKDEGTSYTDLLDSCRHKLAIKLISQNKLPLSEVTYILGFSDQSNFSRAFKRWTGVTPHHYKDS